MASDYVHLNAQQVANGLGAWEQVANTLQSRSQDLSARINGMLADSPWGTDEPGSAFVEKFEPAKEFTTKGPDAEGSLQYFAAGERGLVETGKKVRTSVEASLGADQLQAKEMDINVPKFNR